jgi:diguanylate cyclase (GGDEF)-like protein
MGTLFDPATALIVSTILVLLNGAVLGFIHRELPPDLQPAAFDWRVGTLLLAGGQVLLAAQRLQTGPLLLIAGNAVLFAGLTTYWRAVVRFAGRRQHLAMLLPALAGTLGIALLSADPAALVARVGIATAVSVVVSLAAAGVLVADQPYGRSTSARVLAVLFAALALFMIARGAWFAAAGDGLHSIVDHHWINAVTPIALSVLPVIGTTAFLLMCAERIRRRWEDAAATDGLTGLPNRRASDLELARRFAARDQGGGFVAAVIDADHFKQLNDRHGHAAGDAALRAIAGALRAALRAGDFVARQGGEEFLVLAAPGTPDAAITLGERLRRSVADLDVGEFGPLRVSIGMALPLAHDPDADAVLRRADRALYAAKQAGRNRAMLGEP